QGFNPLEVFGSDASKFDAKGRAKVNAYPLLAPRGANDLPKITGSIVPLEIDIERNFVSQEFADGFRLDFDVERGEELSLAELLAIRVPKKLVKNVDGKEVTVFNYTFAPRRDAEGRLTGFVIKEEPAVAFALSFPQREITYDVYELGKTLEGSPIL